MSITIKVEDLIPMLQALPKGTLVVAPADVESGHEYYTVNCPIPIDVVIKHHPAVTHEWGYTAEAYDEIIGTSTLEHARAALAYGKELLDDEELARFEEIVATHKPVPGLILGSRREDTTIRTQRRDSSHLFMLAHTFSVADHIGRPIAVFPFPLHYAIRYGLGLPIYDKTIPTIERNGRSVTDVAEIPTWRNWYAEHEPGVANAPIVQTPQSALDVLVEQGFLSRTDAITALPRLEQFVADSRGLEIPAAWTRVGGFDDKRFFLNKGQIL